MARNVGLQILRGVKANVPTLEVGESYLATDTNEHIIGTTAGNFVFGLPVFNAAGTSQQSSHVIADRVTLTGGGTATVTLVGRAVFTSATSYSTVICDSSANHSAKVVQTSGSSFTITGTGGDVIEFICIGN
jgi:hypothetical protein